MKSHLNSNKFSYLFIYLILLFEIPLFALAPKHYNTSLNFNVSELTNEVIEKWHEFIILETPNSSEIRAEMQGYYDGDFMNNPYGHALSKKVYLKNPKMLGYRDNNNVSLSFQDNDIFSNYIEIPKHLKEFINWFNFQLNQLKLSKNPSTRKILLFAAKTHIRFVKIHPFHDGNGRTAEIITNYILTTFNLPNIKNIRIDFENIALNVDYAKSIKNNDPFLLLQIFEKNMKMPNTSSRLSILLSSSLYYIKNIIFHSA